MKYEKDDIINLLETRKEFVIRSLLYLYSQMEDDEKQAKESIHENNRGFNKVDTKLMCEAVKDIQNGKELETKIFNQVRFRLKKYTKQLLLLANENLKNKEKEYEQISLFDMLDKEEQKFTCLRVTYTPKSLYIYVSNDDASRTKIDIINLENDKNKDNELVKMLKSMMEYCNK